MLCYWEAKRIVYWLHLIDYIIFMKTYVPLKYVVLNIKKRQQILMKDWKLKQYCWHLTIWWFDQEGSSAFGQFVRQTRGIMALVIGNIQKRKKKSLFSYLEFRCIKTFVHVLQDVRKRLLPSSFQNKIIFEIFIAITGSFSSAKTTSSSKTV